ncbi:MAG: ester cyclase [Ardenticatenaceae bacterium]|nr:ester cyclase [Ardenticatenaceae bacterium]HBY94176.1 ester cyclase [Chloroflexota bacterium]
MSSEANKAVIQRYLQEGPTNEAIALASLTEDATFYDPGAPPSIGPEGQRRRSAILFSAFPDSQFTVEDLIAEADEVVARWTFRGTHRGPFAGIPPTGKQIQMTGITIYRLRDGKIAEARSNIDQLGLLQQLGVLPAAPGSSQ